MTRRAPRLALRGLTLGFVLACGACKSEPESSSPAEQGPTSQPSDPQPGEAPTSQPSVSGAVPVGLEALRPIVGLTPEAAGAWLKEHQVSVGERPETPILIVRPIRIDGQDQVVTMDLRNDRVNVVVEQGVISAIEGIG